MASSLTVSAKAVSQLAVERTAHRVNATTSRVAVGPLEWTASSAPLPRRLPSSSRFLRRRPALHPCRAAADSRDGKLPPSAAVPPSVTPAETSAVSLLEQPEQRELVADVARLLSKPKSYYYSEHHHEQQKEPHGLLDAFRKNADGSSNGAHSIEDEAAASVKEGTTVGEVAALELVKQLSPQGRQVLLTALFPGADNSEAEEEFEHADVNHDGVLDESEFEHYVDEQQAKLDAALRPLDAKQLTLLASKEAIGNMGFGITKNTVMIISGDFIASTLGASFGFSTLMAAGLGNAVADVIGTWCREAIESSSSSLLPGATFSSHQLEQPKAQMYATGGAVLGVTVGGLIGLSPLFFLPTRGSGGGAGGHGAGPAVTAGLAAASAAASAMKVAAPIATLASAEGVEQTSVADSSSAAAATATADTATTTAAAAGPSMAQNAYYTRGITAHASISAAQWMGPSTIFRPLPLGGAAAERGGLGVALVLALSAFNVLRRVREILDGKNGGRKDLEGNNSK